jgi:hypothetical protein
MSTTITKFVSVFTVQEAVNRLNVLEERLNIQSPLRQNSLRIEQRKDKVGVRTLFKCYRDKKRQMSIIN